MPATRPRKTATAGAGQPAPASAAPIEPQTKGARTKALIKQVVADLVDEKGVDGVVLEDVCRRTDLTIGAFYFHFSNKDAALEEVAIDSLQAYYDGLSGAPDSLNLYHEVHAILESSIEVHVRHPRMARLMYVMVPRSNRVYVHWLQARDRLVERLAGAMARERERGGPQDQASRERQRGGPQDPASRERQQSAPAAQDYLYAQFLLAGAEGFFENAFYGADPQFAQIDLKPANLARDIAVLWYRAITARTPRDSLVAESHRLFAERLPAARTRRPRAPAKAPK